jgi:hypothetical protein
MPERIKKNVTPTYPRLNIRSNPANGGSLLPTCSSTTKSAAKNRRLVSDERCLVLVSKVTLAE